MSAKLLFLFGIVVTHGAVGAVLLKQDPPPTVVPVSSCVQTPLSLPHFDTRIEVLAMYVAPVPAEDSMRP